MKTYELTTPPTLDEENERIADLHSLINVLNVIHLQLVHLELDLTEQAATFQSLQKWMQDIAQRFRNGEDPEPLIQKLRESEALFEKKLAPLQEEIDNEAGPSQLAEARENFASIFSILNVRLDEFLYRLRDPDVWVILDIKTFQQQLKDVFYAIEKNANGRFLIRYNLAQKDDRDYYIDLKIETHDNSPTLNIPLRLKDVIRDLLANARKYTPPGGKVALGVFQAENELSCVIEDNGCGIPEDELEKVCEFGYRARNVKEHPTMGGGFGLTKAAWLVLRWGGSFTLASEENKGTTIRITLPCHAHRIPS